MGVVVYKTRISTIATSHTAVDEDLRCEIDTCVFDGVEDFGGSEKKKKYVLGQAPFLMIEMRSESADVVPDERERERFQSASESNKKKKNVP